MAPFALPYLLLFLLRLLLHLFVVVAQTTGNISVGSSLAAGDNASWLSPSQDFAFGFHQIDNDNFLLAIWYYKLPQFTAVWYANGDNPAPRNSKLELTAGGGLVLRDVGAQELWSSGKIGTRTAAVAYAVMNDTGNFQVLDENSNPIWESFKNPTDTLLPTQFIELGGLLSSRKSQTNFSRGRFQFRLLGDGNVVLHYMNLPTNFTYDTYYTSDTARDAANLSDSGYRVIVDPSGYLYILKRNGQNSSITKPEDAVSIPSEYYRKVSLNPDGVLTLSSHSKNSSNTNETWRTLRSIPDNVCVNITGNSSLGYLGSGPCGYNSICTIQTDGRPKCMCPDGYTLLDPIDAYSGCISNFLVGCDNIVEQKVEYFIQEIPNTGWLGYAYEKFSPSDIESCKSFCLHDCLCAAAVFKNNSCLKLRLPLSYGKNMQFGTTALVKLIVNNSSPQSPHPHIENAKNHRTLVIVVSVLLGSSVFVNFIFVGGICTSFFIYYKKKLVGTRPNESSIGSNLRIFSYKELTEATNGFKEELGRGSCGIVYRGETKSSGLIAVKMLDRVFEDNDKEFKAEVSVIGQTHHKNLVRLVGYCEEKQHRLLVYEYLINGTLATFLFGDGLRPSWNQRTQIAYGIARGLVYLHEECSTQIIHCDIKPQNILLDENYNARISDFGLAKLLLINQSHTKTSIRGTKGYVAPDWFRAAPVSVKVDVYSFGVVLLEIVCCRRNVDMEVDGVEKRILTDWVYNCYLDGKLDALVEYDMEAMREIKMVEKFVMVAIWCLQEDPHIRPTMKKVMLMLEGIVQILVPPTPFSFTSIN